jgi:hypothetical protein
MTTELATYQANDDGWADAAREAAERHVRGTLLKFADRQWTKGNEAIPLEEGTHLVALETAAGWVKWHDGKPDPANYRMRQPGKSLPEREELGDLDKDQWEPGPDGAPRDPWQNTRFVYLVDPNSAEAFTFSTSSWGGRGAVADLGDQIQRMRYAHPGAVPIVELGWAPMQTKFGRKSRPIFRVVAWKKGGPAPEEAPRIEHKPGPNKYAEAKGRASTTTEEALEDAIPF